MAMTKAEQQAIAEAMTTLVTGWRAKLNEKARESLSEHDVDSLITALVIMVGMGVKDD